MLCILRRYDRRCLFSISKANTSTLRPGCRPDPNWLPDNAVYTACSNSELTNRQNGHVHTERRGAERSEAGGKRRNRGGTSRNTDSQQLGKGSGVGAGCHHRNEAILFFCHEYSVSQQIFFISDPALVLAAPSEAQPEKCE